MTDNSRQEDLDVVDKFSNSKLWLWGAILFFLLITLTYLSFSSSQYRITSKVIINGNSQSTELVIDELKSRYLLQKTIDQLPFRVSYYQKKTLKQAELYGDSLPVKLVFNGSHINNSKARIIVTIINDKQLQITQGDTICFYEFNKLINKPYGNFKIVRGPAFAKNHSPITLTFNEPGELLDQYYKDLKVRSVDDDPKVIAVSVVTSTPEKGIDLLNKLFEIYNQHKVTIKQTPDNSLNAISGEIAILKKRAEVINKQTHLRQPVKQKKPVHKIDNAQDKLKLNTLYAIEPYVKSSVNQFALIPDNYAIRDAELKRLISQFNKVELDKQRVLQDSQANHFQIINLNKQIAILKSSILQKINIEKNEIKGISQASGPSVNYTDSLAKVNKQLQIKQHEYAVLLQNRVNKKTIVITKPILTIIEKPGINKVTIYPKPVFVCLFALVSGILIAMAISFIKNLNIQLSNITDFKKLNNKINELINVKEID